MISPTSNAVALTTDEMPRETKDSARIVQRCLSTSWMSDRSYITSRRSTPTLRLPSSYRTLYSCTSNRKTRRRRRTSTTTTTARCWPPARGSHSSSLQLTAADVRQQSDLAKTSIDSLVVLPTLTSYGTEKALTELSTTLATLQARAHPLKERPELLETLLGLSKNLTTLWERFNQDNPDNKLVLSTISTPKGMSKFDRLPRIELPSFNGEGSEWRPYWEKFTNALSKDTTLTDVDRLSFLVMTMKCKEGREIIDSHTRRSPDYEAAVRALKERYDQPRVICRTTHQSFSQHGWELTNEGIGQIITLIQRTIATMKECAVDSLETLYTVIAELHMPDDFFRYWTEKTADAKTPPNSDKLIEMLQQYRLRLQGRTIDASSTLKSSTAHPVKQKQWKSSSTTFHVQKDKDCAFCHDGNHPLYLCDAFKAKSVEDSYRRAIHKLVPLLEDDSSFPSPVCSGLDPPQEEATSPIS